MDENTSEDIDSGLREECVLNASDVIELLEILTTGMVSLTTGMIEMGKYIEETKVKIEKNIEEYMKGSHGDSQDSESSDVN